MQQIFDKETIEIQYTIVDLLNRDLKKANNVYCKIFLKNGNQEELLIRETGVSFLHPIFLSEIHFHPFTIVYKFGMLQNLRIEIFEQGGNVDQLIAQVHINIGQIISLPSIKLDIITIQKIGAINIKMQRALEENEQYDCYYMLWEGQNLLNTDFMGKSDPFLIFYKMKFEKWEKVLETYFIKDNLNPNWNQIVISDELLYKDNPQQLIKVECWDNSKSGKHNFIGEAVTSKNELLTGNREYILSNNGKTKGIGTLKLVKFACGVTPKLIDYLLACEKFNLIIGIDFTGSNGNPESSESLHYLHEKKLNQYQQTLQAFSDIILYYTVNVEMLGFGGIPKGKDKAKFCFPLNDNEKHPLRNTNDIIQVYNNCVKQIKQSGPTYVSEILKHAKEQAKIISKTNDQPHSTFQQFLILLIITDGIINDMAETRQIITDCEQQPISIIFIGVGDEDFSEMKQIFSKPFVTNNNYRQNYQFESFKEHNDPVLLMQAVLENIREQYLKYKNINGRAPFKYFN